MPASPERAPDERAARPWDLLNRQLGRVDRETARERLDACRCCPRLSKLTRQCSECGCFMALKVKLPNASCPLGKWDQVAPPRPDAATHDATQPAGTRQDAKTTLAFVIDEEVVAVLAVDGRLGAIMLSNRASCTFLPAAPPPSRSGTSTPMTAPPEPWEHPALLPTDPEARQARADFRTSGRSGETERASLDGLTYRQPHVTTPTTQGHRGPCASALSPFYNFAPLDVGGPAGSTAGSSSASNSRIRR
jgi:hypothetical protein